MIKKLCFFLCLTLLLANCGNEETDFPSANSTGANNVPAVDYKIFTLVFYKKPYSPEMLYHLISLANFNKIESSYFLFFDVEDKSFENDLKDFLTRRTENVNIISLCVVPRDIRDVEKIKPYVEKAIFLFPPEKPVFPNAPTTSNSNAARTSIQIFPTNYNYMKNAVKMRYSLQDKTFLATVLKTLTGGNINIPPVANVNEIAYIQGETRPQANVQLLQGNTTDSFIEKSSMKALDDGSITGVPIDPTLETQINLSYKKNQTTYWVMNMRSSFLFFNLPFIPDNHIDLSSYFTPLKMENLSFANKNLKIDSDKDNKVLYALHIDVDPSLDSKTTSFKGDFKEGELYLKIPSQLLPVSYSVNNISLSLSGNSAIKLFTEVKEIKKDYMKHSISGSELTLAISDEPNKEKDKDK